ncbi:flagellar motor protein MotB [Nitratidesulfovibrio sp. SRB-5]|uniref:OmpA/MotB family protein n=1 Tax=Nitratidesulfovibrio sp. SRB-5 TaxID=2872636 RepID=UPI0010278502|nr:flagellar motor protein MotB [Nitratidesulfovibrio sp. SRB-5]MBZ2173169.1 OmpA family protein [Nitratidesulfovibrio sp. SRB-5]RXF76265.1 flagellar motor protein MotB [Desulfovibrio sp. DS-1]
MADIPSVPPGLPRQASSPVPPHAPPHVHGPARRPRRAPAEDKPRQPWLLTYSDLVTLLLTFFVLLLSMSSMNRVTLSRIGSHFGEAGEQAPGVTGSVPERIRLLEPLLARPAQVFAHQREIKELLFPGAELPPGIDRSTLDKNLRILEHPEGVVLALTDDLLFAPGQWQLREASRPLLGMLAEVLEYVTADVAIAGHSDPHTEGVSALEQAAGTGGGAGTVTGDAIGYELAGRRALTVLEYFVQRKLDPARFSVAGYGPDRPSLAGQPPSPGAPGVPEASGEPDAAAGSSDPDRNRRVEILVKTTPRLGGY